MNRCADGDRFESTAATASPWDTSLQHGGPPAALLARAVERVRPDPAMRIARLTVDMLGGIPQGTVRTEAEVLRPGSPLRRLVEGASGAAGPMSAILWGPPGTGKTTLAHLVAPAADRDFVELSAVTAGVKDVRAVMERAAPDA